MPSKFSTKGKYNWFNKNQNSSNENEDVTGSFKQSPNLDVEKQIPVPETTEKNEEKENKKKISQFRRALPQFLACTAKNLVLLDLGMAIGYSTIVIPVLLEATSGLKFTQEQASWFGSVVFICQPAGSFISGFMSEAWGRKRSLMLVNFPHILGWFLMYSADDLGQLFTAAVILGVGIGFMEAPLLNYIGEISEPQWRGILVQYSQIYVSLGFFLIFLLGTVTDWRMASAITSSIPMLAVIAIFFIPESPAWLLSKGREKDAEKSLCWLRGWVTPVEIQEEFTELVKYNKKLHENADESSEKHRGLKKLINFCGLDYLFKNQILRPFILVNIFFVFANGAGITGTRPYMVEIFKQFGSTIDPFWATVIDSAIGVFANVVGCLTISKIGKRMICHISFLVGASCCILICIYGVSFSGSSASWVLVVLYYLFNFVWTFGIGLIPWILVSEIFPLQGKGLASGISAGISYLSSFFFTKTYYDITNAFSLSGAFAFFGAIMIVGWLFFYFLIPETEGKSLEEVQIMYANVYKKHQCQPGKQCPRLSAISLGNSKF